MNFPRVFICALICVTSITRLDFNIKKIDFKLSRLLDIIIDYNKNLTIKILNFLKLSVRSDIISKK